MIRRLLRVPVVLALPLALVIGACAEKLETAATCPILCPGQQLTVIDTLIDPTIVLDSSLIGYPILGAERPLLLATRGDTLDARVIVRFDTLVREYTPTGGTSTPITSVDSAFLRVQLRIAGLKVPQSFFIDAFDVGDTLLVDTLPMTLLPLFTASRLLGSAAVDSSAFTDSSTISIPIDSAMLRTLIMDPGAVFRVGLQLRSAETGAFWITPSEDGPAGPSLRFRVSADTTIAAITLRPASKTPTKPFGFNGAFYDYSLLVDAPNIRTPGRFAVGGLPGGRSYLRFDLPVWLTDSVAILRARLELTQDPVYDVDIDDSLSIRARVVLAGSRVTDLYTAATLLASLGTFITDSIRTAPGDSGVVSIEINGVAPIWRTVDGVRATPSAIVLSSDLEGSSPLGVRFFGLGAAPALRPRLRVSYVPNLLFGRP